MLPIDPRFPHIVRITPEIPGADWRVLRSLREAERGVMNRAGLFAAWDDHRGDIIFYPPNVGPEGLHWHIRVRYGPVMKPIETHDIDECVRVLLRNRRPWRATEKIMEDQYAKQAADGRARTDKMLDSKRKDSEDFLAHRRNRRGMGKHFKGGAIVDGFKKGADR